jgi:nucleotide-binding universal stress UspA family protein
VFRDILVVVQASPAGTHVLHEAIELAQSARGRLTILTPVPRPPAWVSTPMTAGACEPLARELEQEAVRSLAAARDAVPGEMPLTTILTRRRLCDAVCARLADHAHDLLVLGACSAARRLERRTPIPVLVVPAGRPGGAPIAAARASPASPAVDATPDPSPVAQPQLRLPG